LIKIIWFDKGFKNKLLFTAEDIQQFKEFQIFSKV